MRKMFALLIQICLGLFGLGVLAFLLLEPQFEGRNVNATFTQIYFHDGFWAYVALSSIAFFVGLYQLILLIGQVGRNQLVSTTSLVSLKTIKRCAYVMIVFLMGTEIYIHTVQRAKGEDIAGGSMIGWFLTAICLVVIACSIKLERNVLGKLSKPLNALKS